MRYLTLSEVLELYERVMEQSGGSVGIHDLNALESAIAQPRMAFGGEELYPTIAEKAAALGFSIIKNHPLSRIRGTRARLVLQGRKNDDGR